MIAPRHGALGRWRSRSPREPVRPALRDRLDWRRIGHGVRYVRRHGFLRLLHRIFPRLGTYDIWLRLYDRVGPRKLSAVTRNIGLLCPPPLISLIVPVGPTDRRSVRRMLDRMAAQAYPDWEVCLGVGAPAFDSVAKAVAAHKSATRVRLAKVESGCELAARANAALAVATGAVVILVSVNDELAPHALHMLAAELGAHPDAALVYSDEDTIGPGRRRCKPRFKTDWNPDLLLGQDMVGRFAAYRRDLVVEVGGWRCGFNGAEEHDLALRVGERLSPDRIRHMPMILYHRRGRPGQPAAMDANPHCRAVADHLARTGVAARVEPLPAGLVRVRRDLPMLPRVSVIVPTRDQEKLLQRCVDGLLHDTDYDALEIVIVDNDSIEAVTHAYFAALIAEPRVRIVRYTGPFNFSAINNLGVRSARHEILCLLNNDIEIIHRDWLREMVSHAVRPEVGAVGAKLYYPNDTIQHAGTILGLGGGADHAFRNFDRIDPGYCNRLTLTQNLSAVTAACMVLRRQVYNEVGGLDEVNLPVAFNDVDLCLRIRKHGYRVVWTPFAELYHHESISRGSDYAPEKIDRFMREVAYFKRRWASVIAHDPYYNSNLTVERHDFTLAFPPRVPLPWESVAAGPRQSNIGEAEVATPSPARVPG